jgi:hypothetical protein
LYDRHPEQLPPLEHGVGGVRGAKHRVRDPRRIHSIERTTASSAMTPLVTSAVVGTLTLARI